MTVLRSIYQNYLVFNCPCGYVGKVAVLNLMLRYGGDTTVDAIMNIRYAQKTDLDSIQEVIKIAFSYE